MARQWMATSPCDAKAKRSASLRTACRLMEAWWEWRLLNYRELAQHLIPYLVDGIHPCRAYAGFWTSILWLWGLSTCWFVCKPTSRYGSPDDFKYFVDMCHQAGIGVVLWLGSSTLPSDDHGLWTSMVRRCSMTLIRVVAGIRTGIHPSTTLDANMCVAL